MAQISFSDTASFNRFSFGINTGLLRPSVITGGSNDYTRPQYSLGYGLNARYQFTHRFGIQADFVKGNLKGDNSKNLTTGFAPIQRPNYAFKTNLHFGISLSGVVTLGNIYLPNSQNAFAPYLTAGAGLAHYNTNVIKSGTTNFVPFRDGKTLKQLFIPIGIGVKYKVSDMVNLDLGYRGHFVDNDDFDGTDAIGSPHHDKFSYGAVGVEFFVGKRGRKQAMFENPILRVNNRLKTEINQLQSRLDSLDAKFTDSDGDGVFDITDKCPGTPKGVQVDTKGCPLDTDGDGVPDYKDKEKNTPTQCQPVDADGVGKCPEPDCCKDLRGALECDLEDLPDLFFGGHSMTLTDDTKAILDRVVFRLRTNPYCSIILRGFPGISQASKIVCDSRLSLLKYYLEKHGINPNRVWTDCWGDGKDLNVIQIVGNFN